MFSDWHPGIAQSSFIDSRPFTSHPSRAVTVTGPEEPALTQTFPSSAMPTPSPSIVKNEFAVRSAELERSVSAAAAASDV